MRRAYNAGRWNAARNHASKLLSKPTEQTLARSVIVRSYWNEGRFQELVDCTKEWHDELSHSYREQAIDRLKVTGGAKKLTMMKEEKLQRLRDDQPQPKVPINWSAEHMMQIFLRKEVAFGSAIQRGMSFGTCLQIMICNRPTLRCCA
jgi:hypothetical protein